MNNTEGFHKFLEAGDKPVVAAMSDTALGGGCELAVACTGRICTKSTKIGLPELQLGLIPGELHLAAAKAFSSPLRAVKHRLRDRTRGSDLVPGNIQASATASLTFMNA